MNEKISRSDLVKVAEELNELLFINPEEEGINVKEPKAKLQESILTAAELLEPTDELSKKTEEVLKSLTNEKKETQKQKNKIPAKKDKPVKWKTVIEIIVNNPDITLDELVAAMAASPAGKMARSTCDIYLREIVYALKCREKQG